jgi:hypothetical protein
MAADIAGGVFRNCGGRGGQILEKKAGRIAKKIGIRSANALTEGINHVEIVISAAIIAIARKAIILDVKNIIHSNSKPANILQ